MPRPRLESRDALLQSAMWAFWTRGYSATSIDDLVKATGVARSGIYAEFGSKDGAFRKCLSYYQEVITGPAIEILATHENGLEAIQAYFDYFIDMHRKHGMPGPGCFVANVVTEIAPHSQVAKQASLSHRAALLESFKIALRRAEQQVNCELASDDLNSLANFLVIASQGLWSYARVLNDLAELEKFAKESIGLVEAKISVLATSNKAKC